MIGAGAYGEAYRAKIRRPDCPETIVAYKKIVATFIQSCDEGDLKDEAKIHMQLDHPNIVICFGIVFEPRNYGIVLEFMKHGVARNYLKKNDYFEAKLAVIRDVASGVKYLHKHHPPVVHGDLKIDNVLVGEDEIAKVCDLGFSRWKEYSKSQSKHVVPLGTLSHVPSERLSRSNLRKNEMFDIYSFGITVWKILTLKSPYGISGGIDSLIQVWVEKGQRPDLKDIPEDVDTGVVDLMQECWDGEIPKRPHFEDIVRRLEKN